MWASTLKLSRRLSPGFVHKHPRLSAQQLRFLQVLQNYIAQNGGIEIERLYEPPFTTIHAESVDGIFTDPSDVDDLLAIVNAFRIQAAGIMSTLTTQQKGDIDKLWTEFWTGGITNPLTVIEQISFLMFARLLDVMETTGERKAERTKKPFSGRFSGKDDPRRWKNFKQKDAGEMLRLVRDEVFPHFRKLNGGTTFGEYMQDAQLMIQKPSLLVSAVNMIDKLPITEGDAKGDLYEYLLSKLTTAGINGQFRTPRHIIRFMVDLLEPKPTEIVGDPACGTAGFLVERHAVSARNAHFSRRAAQGRERRDDLHRRPARAVPRAHSERDVPRVRLRRNDATHRIDEPDAARRR